MRRNPAKDRLRLHPKNRLRGNAIRCLYEFAGSNPVLGMELRRRANQLLQSEGTLYHSNSHSIIATWSAGS